MNFWMVSPSYSSMIWASRAVPSVAETSAWVSPRVKSAEPWVRGSRPTSISMSRISSSRRLSKRVRSLSTTSRRISSSRRVMIFFTWLRFASSSAGMLLEVGLDHLR